MTERNRSVLLIALAAMFPGLLTRPACAQEQPASPPVLVAPGTKIPRVAETQLLPDGPIVPWDPNSVGDFQLIDQDGKPVTRRSLLGRPWVANFIFGSCSTHCPLTSKRIKELIEELGATDVRFVTISVDPVNDTPFFLKGLSEIYVPRNAKPAEWLWLTGTEVEIYKLIREGFKVPAWKYAGTDVLPGMEFAHSNHLVHVDAQGKIVGRYRSDTAAELMTLQQVLRGKISTPPEHQPATREQILALRRLREGDPLASLPAWAQRLPATNASLNGLATLLLVAGFLAAKRMKFRLHKRMMLTAFFVSVLFLASYLTYHACLTLYTDSHGRKFTGPASLLWVYRTILITHVVLATTVPVLAIITIRNGLRAYPAKKDEDAFRSMMQERYDHKRWAKITFPIWLYVSVTGVVIYGMLYWL